MAEKGTISVNTENIFPIIKKFLYSDHDIFLRELVSNAVDATQKIKRLASLGEYQGELGETKVKVVVDKEAKTITISDSGIGMTEDEIKKYINQIAFSGATEFVEKYKDEDMSSIIGKFGLGFYSAFMVSDKVEIVTLSHKEGAEAARWSCTGSTDFEITPAERETRGSDIILHVNEESSEFLENAKISEILNRYCRFLPVEVEFEEKAINSTDPIWTKSPSELKDEDYLNFYKELYPMAEEPMFWIHLNVDYPFNLTGVLYFPKVKNDITQHKDKIQLYSRQVFITDEVKDIVPEFLTLLHGVIDSPDIPLNVSRSYLQADGNVKKINSYITKKVADKLEDLYKSDREAYDNKWESVGLFVKYGMVTDQKFYEKATKFCLLKDIDGKHYTFAEYKELVEGNQKDKNDTVVYLYTTDPGKQDSFINSAKKRGYNVLLMDGIVDTHFVGSIEQKEEKISLKRVDSDPIEKLIEKEETIEAVLSEDEQKQLVEVYQKVVGDDKVTVSAEAMPTDEMPVVITIPEFMRRMEEMYQQGGMPGAGSLPKFHTVTLNANHVLNSQLLKEVDDDKAHAIAKQAFDLALLSQNMLSGKDLTSFIERSFSQLSN